VQVVEDPWPLPVDVARDDRRAQLIGGRPTGLPTGGEAARRHLQRSVSPQSEVHQPESTPIVGIRTRTGVDLTSATASTMGPDVELDTGRVVEPSTARDDG
jgi:hypothetical protein